MTELAARLIQCLTLAVFAYIPLAAGADVEQIGSPRLAALNAAMSAGEQDAVQSFWHSVEQSRTPLVEDIDPASPDVLMTFLWRARPNQESVNGRVMYGSAMWERAGDPMQRLGGSDVWYRTYRIPRKARFTYYLAWPQGDTPRADALAQITANGITYDALIDPLARWTYRADADEVRRELAYAEGPDAPAERFVARRDGVPRGKLETLDVDSKILANQRKVSIYTPPGYAAQGKSYGLLLLFDRKSYLSNVPTPTILDNMLADRAIPPLVAVLVDSRVSNDPDGDARSRELPPNPMYQRFLREELIPLIRGRYNVSKDPARNVVAGSSFGGLAAAFTALSNPDVFGNVISQSGSYWWYPGCCDPGSEQTVFLSEDSGWMIKELATRKRAPVQIYMDVGLWESADQLMPNRILRSVLQGKGYRVTYQEFTGGHDYVSWRSTLSDGLIAVVGTRGDARPRN